MSSITSPIMLDATGKEIAAALQALVAIQTNEATTVDTWAKFQTLVRAGVAESIYPVGTKLTVEHTTYGTVTWIVAAYNHHPDPTGRVQNSVTLVSDGCPVNSLQYDSTEAMYYAESELPAGTYHFTLMAGYDETYGGGKTLQFTLSKPVPAGGQIVFAWSYQVQAAACKISTYESSSSTTAIESGIAVSEGSDGTDLGVTDGTGNMNHIHRARYGSNNWKQSAMRQFLNSAGAAGTFWKPQTKYDRPPSWVASTAGWMAGLPEEFLAVVGKVDITTKTNSVFETGDDPIKSSYVTRDTFWLLSRDELGYGVESGIPEGSVLDLFKGATDIDRIKYNKDGTARYWWMRSPIPGNASIVRIVYPSGALLSYYASHSYAVVPACVIY